MDSGTFIAVYLPIFIVIFIILPSNNRNMFIVKKIRKKKGENIMSNEMIKECIGKTCTITTGSLGTSYNKVVVVEVVDNWIKVTGKGKTDLINIDFVQNIKIFEKKD